MKFLLIATLLLVSAFATNEIVCVESVSEILIETHELVDAYNRQEQIPTLIEKILNIARTIPNLGATCRGIQAKYQALPETYGTIFSYSDDCWESIQQDLRIALSLEVSAHNTDINEMLVSSSEFYPQAMKTVELCKAHQAQDIWACFSDALEVFQRGKQLESDYAAEKDIGSLLKDIEAIAREIVKLKEDCTESAFEFEPLPFINQLAYGMSPKCWQNVQILMGVNARIGENFQKEDYRALEQDALEFYEIARGTLTQCSAVPHKLTGIVDEALDSITNKLKDFIEQAVFTYVDQQLQGKTFQLENWSSKKFLFVSIESKGFVLSNIKLDPTKTTVDVNDWKFTVQLEGIQLNLHGDVITHFFGAHDTELNMSTQNAFVTLAVQVTKEAPFVDVESVQVNVGKFDIQIIKGSFMTKTVTHWMNYHDVQIANFIQKIISDSVNLLQNIITDEVKKLL